MLSWLPWLIGHLPNSSYLSVNYYSLIRLYRWWLWWLLLRGSTIAMATFGTREISGLGDFGSERGGACWIDWSRPDMCRSHWAQVALGNQSILSPQRPNWCTCYFTYHIRAKRLWNRLSIDAVDYYYRVTSHGRDLNLWLSLVRSRSQIWWIMTRYFRSRSVKIIHKMIIIH